jgi:hypothetical protein
MRFARIVFSIAGVWGVLILTPLYFMFDAVGRHYPPPITHPDLYYGFISVTLAWQVAFLVIARDPHRFRPMMIPAIVEKFGFVATLGVLYAQRQLQLSQLLGAGPDLVLGLCFLAAFVMTSDRARTHAG